MSEKDNNFLDRADAFIHLANSQMEKGVAAGEVSPSFMYGLARYSAWFSASGWTNAKDMTESKAETVDFFVNEFRRMLELNMEDYIQSFDNYVQASEQIKGKG